METSITYLKEQFQLKDPDIRSYSPLTLAYIGDGIYELYIRTILIKQGNCQVNKLHKQASRLVKAQAQSEMVPGAGATFYPGRRSSLQERSKCKVLHYSEECHYRGLSPCDGI